MKKEIQSAGQDRTGAIPSNGYSTIISIVVSIIALAWIMCGIAEAKPAFDQVGRDGGFERAEDRDIGISGSNQNERLDCRGGKLQVSGSSNRISAVGPCSGVQVSGSSNEIFLDLLPGSHVDVSGSSNVIEYRILARGPGAIVRQSGSNNAVERRR
jgi:hypothetical protein